MAAAVLTGRTVHPRVSMGVAPGSRQVLEMLSRSGALAEMIRSGARVLESACGPCIGQGFSPASGSATARTFNRNFLNRTGTRNDRCYLVSPETAVATALTGRLTDPRSLDIPFPEWEPPRAFLVDDRMVIPPPPRGQATAIVRKETVGDPPLCRPFPDRLDGRILLKLGDKVTTDHIMPAGVHLKLRSNIPEYAKVVFECFNESGKPTFAECAAGVRDSGCVGVIVAGESYGQGSSREHAAICPMYLGVRLVVARSIERIHAANLINFGILPLLFTDPADHGGMRSGAELLIEGVGDQLAAGSTVNATCVDASGVRRQLRLGHALSEEDVATVLAGGRLNTLA